MFSGFPEQLACLWRIEAGARRLERQGPPSGSRIGGGLPSADRRATVLIVEPDGTSTFRVTPEAQYEENVTRLTMDVALKPDGDMTLLTLIHEQFFDEAARDRHNWGWNGAMDKLERMFA